MRVEWLDQRGHPPVRLCRVGDFRPCTRLPAGGLGAPAGAVDAAEGGAVGHCVSGHVEIGVGAFLRGELRLRQKGKPRHGMEGCLAFVPLDARILDPEARVAAPAPIRHSRNVQKLEPDIEAAHRTVVFEMPNQLMLQGVRIASLQRLRGVPG